MNIASRFVTLSELTVELAASRSAVRRWLEDGEVTAYSFGTGRNAELRYEREDVDAWIEQSGDDGEEDGEEDGEGEEELDTLENGDVLDESDGDELDGPDDDGDDEPEVGPDDDGDETDFDSSDEDDFLDGDVE